ncbi:hypothetical protein J8V57_19975 [Xenorhabdus sp. PB61.4]|uniref:hypothetical protein n=1 Tax=Xenorhabdus sp. PB61.4 TaxID=2788940 RepID=UPI001E6543E7|nr:hypothetical protein [Xenorhabdus sp. PB61.4]MCC8368461.1 hypothetical protein [Xenorhabdus sp. PB61.4]
MKIKFKKYFSILILFIPIPLLSLSPPNISICNQVKNPPKGVIYKNPKVGALIAKRLNKRFNNIVSECGNNFSTPAYECSGIILRAINPNETNFWEKGQAFSYFRADLNTFKLFKDRPTAYVINGSGSYKNPYGKQVYAKCVYPLDGYTISRNSNSYLPGCTRSNLFPDIPGECDKRGITTLEQWKEDFNKIPRNKIPERYAHQCSFDAHRSSGAKEFALNLEARKSLNINLESYDYIQNEIIIKPWNELDYKPQHIPVEAIIYTDFNTESHYPGVHALRYAQAMQCAYVKATMDNLGNEKRVKYPVPIIYLDLEELRIGKGKEIFKYKERDQMVTKRFEKSHAPNFYFLKNI